MGWINDYSVFTKPSSSSLIAIASMETLNTSDKEEK